MMIMKIISVVKHNIYGSETMPDYYRDPYIKIWKT